VFKKIALAATFAILSSTALAAEQASTYWYGGADIGTSKLDDFDERKGGFGVFLGYQFNKHLGVEGTYRRLADFDYGSGTVKADQTGISAIGTLPLNGGFSIYGRLGFNRVELNVRAAGGYRDGDSDHKALYGAGVAYQFSDDISGRLEVQRPYTDVTNLSAGISFRF
jgi:OmpA-OmpF porin, OOP family